LPGLRHRANEYTIDVTPDREVQLGAMAGARHRVCGHADGREGRDIDLGAPAPNDDADAGRLSVGLLVVIISDRVIRLAEPLHVLAINLSD